MVRGRLRLLWCKRGQGFTLIEMLVVVLLIAITATLVVVNLQPDPDKQAHLEAERFAALVDQAREESVLRGRPIAVEVDTAKESYRFLVAGDGWKPIVKDDVFRERKIPEPLTIKVQTGSQANPPDNKIVCQIDGSVSPFTVTIGTKHSGYKVSVDDSQKIVVVQIGQDST